MFRSLVLLALCLGLAAANLSKRKTKNIVKRQSGACADDEFTCNNGHCAQEEWTCDTYDDCGDGSDESLPECPPPGQCTSNHETACSNGDCKPIEFKCDGDDDCGDGTDEAGCLEYQCEYGEFKCADTHRPMCIESSWVCDGDYDCGDKSDEASC